MKSDDLTMKLVGIDRDNRNYKGARDITHRILETLISLTFR